jgi:hypothetical protein
VDKAARIRWTVLLTALAATIVATFYPLEQPPTRVAKPAPVAARASILAPQVGTPAARGVWDPLLSDPFAPRRWDAPPVVVAAPVAPPAPPPPPEPALVAPTGPPALPFQFVGQMSDVGDGKDRVVYLSHGEQALVARVGEVLEGSYQVLDITPLQIEFEHLPTGQKQALALPSRNN